MSDVSVIMPVRNAAATIAGAIRSVLDQTREVREILVIDDLSSDDGIDIARSFGARVRVLANPGRGPGAARRAGVELACGTFIAFCDADDTIAPDKHERQLEVLTSTETAAVVHTGSLRFWSDGNRPAEIDQGGETAVGGCTRVLFERNVVCGASMMLRRSVLLALGNYDADQRASEDYALALRASVHCNFVHLPEVLYRRRRHGHNVTNRTGWMTWYHWRAQDLFRQRCPDAFAALPADVVQEAMIEPVLRAVTRAYWERSGDGYRRLLRLAHRIAPDDPRVAMLRRRRGIPMAALRLLDRVRAPHAKALRASLAQALPWRCRTP